MKGLGYVLADIPRRVALIPHKLGLGKAKLHLIAPNAAKRALARAFLDLLEKQEMNVRGAIGMTFHHRHVPERAGRGTSPHTLEIQRHGLADLR